MGASLPAHTRVRPACTFVVPAANTGWLMTLVAGRQDLNQGF